MSTTLTQEAIVIHGPVTGDERLLAKPAAGEPVTVVLPHPSEMRRQPVPVDEIAPAPAAAKPKADRAVGVDAFRGMFLLLMTFAMTIPMREGLYPDWMYHMQNPPPNGDFVERAGLTWRDLMFPGFLFTMCVAIPITNSLRLAKGMAYPEVIWTAVKRFALLYIFALIIGHAAPYWTGDYTKRGNLIAILGFLVCWPIFLRKPPTWSDKTFGRLKLAGWVAAAAFLFVLPYAYGLTFSLTRRDIIIHALAVVSLLTTTLWLFTQRSPMTRLAALGLVLAFMLGGNSGAVANIRSVIDTALIEPWMIELMIVAIPGTFAGDQIVRWMRAPRDEVGNGSWGAARLGFVALLGLSMAPIAVIGYYNRWLPETAMALTLVGAAALLATSFAKTERERTLSALVRWAAFLVVVGALMESVGGGIKKDPQTAGYLVLTTGVSLGFLLFAMITTDVLKLAKRASRIVVEVGQNPLVAYIAFMLFFNQIAWGTGIARFLQNSPSEALVRSIIFTVATAILVVWTTRKRLFWRT